jgi:hypothetical protein
MFIRISRVKGRRRTYMATYATPKATVLPKVSLEKQYSRMPMWFGSAGKTRPAYPRAFKQMNATKNCNQVIKRGQANVVSTILLRNVRDNETTK